MEILIDLLITAFGYMIYPLAKYKIINKNEKYDNENIKKTLIINSVVVAIVFLIIKYNMYGDALKVNFMPAILYYCINLAIYSEKDKSAKNVNDSKANKIAKYIVIIGGGLLLLCMLIGIIMNATSN